jgi:hypothetical protein
MPKGKSIYATYFESGASTGKYESSLQRVADVWTKIDFSKEKSEWKDEKRERLLDTILAGTELASTIGGSMTGFKEGSSAIQMKQAESGYSGDLDWEEFKTTEKGKEHIGLYSPQKIGRGGEPWEKGKIENLWQSPRYQFGEDVVMSKSQIREYGRDVKDYGKLGVELPTDIYKGESMHAEYRAGYDPEKSWYPGKHAKKIAQTIVPGGEVGYKDLYSRLGKTSEDVVEPDFDGKIDGKPPAKVDVLKPVDQAPERPYVSINSTDEASDLGDVEMDKIEEKNDYEEMMKEWKSQQRKFSGYPYQTPYQTLFGAQGGGRVHD